MKPRSCREILWHQAAFSDGVACGRALRATRADGEKIEEPQLIAKILSHLERTEPEQSQSELPLGARGSPAQSSLL